MASMRCSYFFLQRQTKKAAPSPTITAATVTPTPIPIASEFNEELLLLDEELLVLLLVVLFSHTPLVELNV